MSLILRVLILSGRIYVFCFFLFHQNDQTKNEHNIFLAFTTPESKFFSGSCQEFAVVYQKDTNRWTKHVSATIFFSGKIVLCLKVFAPFPKKL